ncbi:MAG: beta-ketoacyl-ACP synthase II [Chloroflexota bacterium]|nr:beta-ketoacyl-ACP synthase II [Chloroflexota bacterium]
MLDQMRRDVVTGMGAITPLGSSVDKFWNELVAGTCAIDRITRFDASRFAVQISAEVRDFNVEDYAEYIDRKEARRIDWFIQLAVAATAQALKESGLKIDESNADNIGALIGSGIGGLVTIEESMHTLFEKGPMRVSPFTGPYMIPNMAAGQVAITFGAKGPNFSIASACATGTNAIGEAFEIIRRGDADAMITGGVESQITEFGLAAFHRTTAMSTSRNDDPKHASRPFDAKRDGFVFGEGCGILIFEELESATARGAKILAEVASYAANDDAYHISAPAPGGMGAAKAMQRALKKAGLKPDDVDYINAHGTSTLLNDASETAAIKTVFGEHAYNLPISSTKSMVGHLLGAAGAVEAIASVKTIQTGWIHPTINYEYPDPACDLDYVPNQARQKDVRVAMSNSFGFGGHNAIVIFKKFKG